MTQIAVLGAGMVGICTALALQERGHECLVVDRSSPGSETSYGNAGIIQDEAVEPYGLPQNPLTLFRMALGWKNALHLDWRRLASQIPALYSYWRLSAPESFDGIVPTWRQLISEATQRHGRLIEMSCADHLIRREGYWEVYETGRSLGSAIADAERRRSRYGIGFAVADGGMLRKSEPGLQAMLAGAIHWPSAWSCLAPDELVAAYAELFKARGGKLVVGDAASATQTGHGWQVAGEAVDKVVVALGPWSPQMLARFGYRVPMVRKRGYHRHYAGDHGLTRPMLLAEHSVVLSPMKKGLRIATAADLSHGSPPARYPRQLAHGEAVARKMFRIKEPVEEAAWSGTRPCLPGMLPLVCKALRHSGLWVHFGHGHQGFTLGPVTAERLARAIDGDENAIAGLDVGIR